jgi:uncharacterized protein (DUF2141 family)
MKPLHITPALVVLLAAGTAQAQHCVRVEVHNVRPQQGMLMVAAYAEAENYNKKPLTLMQVRPDKDQVHFDVCGATGPSLALSLFQDINGNQKLDTNVIGIPSEPWGASGKPSNFEAPRWETTQVPVDRPIVVKLSQ